VIWKLLQTSKIRKAALIESGVSISSLYRMHSVHRCGLLLTVPCVYLCVCVGHRSTTVSPAKTAKPIAMPFGTLTRAGPQNHVCITIVLNTYSFMFDFIFLCLLCAAVLFILSYRARQLYKHISMLFLFPVKDGKLSTGVNATFNASCYG